MKTLLCRTFEKKSRMLEIAVGFNKPYQRKPATKDSPGERREFDFFPLPSLEIISNDTGEGYFDDDVCRTTIYLSWLFFFIYIDTSYKVEGSSRGKIRKGADLMCGLLDDYARCIKDLSITIETMKDFFKKIKAAMQEEE